MPRSTTYFTDDQKRAIHNAVVQAESKTSAEIMPVVATASGRYDRAEDMSGLVGALMLVSIVWFFLPGDAVDRTGTWEGSTFDWRLPALIAAMLIGFIAGAVKATYMEWLRRLFTPSNQMRDEVNARARAVFFDSRVHHTAGATGLLFYVSLYERRAVVLADAAVTEKLGQATLDAFAKTLTDDIKQSGVADALAKAIATAGDKLGAVLPRQADDVNELEDTLVLLD